MGTNRSARKAVSPPKNMGAGIIRSVPALPTNPAHMAASRNNAATVHSPVTHRHTDSLASILLLTDSSSPSQAASCFFPLK